MIRLRIQVIETDLSLFLPLKDFLNDFWKYSGGEWTWVAGSKMTGSHGTFGTKGTPSPSNIPSSRQSSKTWVDSSDNFWLFGGIGYDSVGNIYCN